jgi:predicted NBD/HSP70 family sugar kinase
MLQPLIEPRVRPPLDPGFRPAVLVNQKFRQEVKGVGVPFVIGLERPGGEISRIELEVFPEGYPLFEWNYLYLERQVKFILWQRGGYRLLLSGSPSLSAFLTRTYSADGERSFDYHFFGTNVYEKPFEVVTCAEEDIPASNEVGKKLGGYLNGNRIGFDLGATDRKVTAMIDGVVVFSEEVNWEPRQNTDPEYHYREIIGAIQSAAAHLPQVDAIGGSSAGIIINNRPMVGSLFRGIPASQFDRVKDLFTRIRDEIGVPFEVINDGDVTALAGSMAIHDNGILGIAMGSSEAAGYVNTQGHIMGWLNELAFAPIDYSLNATVDEWSGDKGCGASYLSQQCVFRLAPMAGIPANDLHDAAKLIAIQNLLEAGDEGAEKIWQTMGVYLGYGIAHYADYYDIDHVLILGRCTSGRGGDLLLEGVNRVFSVEFPELLQKIMLHLPDERIRRVGQSAAAASLPYLSSD